jgi:pimeloyl-ACP methyl ester carboxylesterase
MPEIQNHSIHAQRREHASTPSSSLLKNREVLFQAIGDSEIAYRKLGSGEPLLFIHGYPLSGMTFRDVVPLLSEYFTCYVIDLPGAGDSRWTDQTEFSFKAQVRGLKVFADRLNLKSYSILSHDTGGTIARQLAIDDAVRVRKLIVIGTEIPRHRPPWIRFFQAMSYLPGSNRRFQSSMKSRKFLHSSMGFAGCFYDQNLIDGAFHQEFIEPLIDSEHARTGQPKRLCGIDWKMIDSLALGHGKIQAPVQLIWGEDDTVFPVALARKMVAQFKTCRGLTVIPKAKLFVHEEHPDLVSQECLAFLRDRPSPLGNPTDRLGAELPLLRT